MSIKTLVVFFKVKEYEDSEWSNQLDYLTFDSDRESAARVLNDLKIAWRQGYSTYEITNVVIG